MAVPCQRQAPAGVWSWRQALCTRVPAAEPSTHLESAIASHVQSRARTFSPPPPRAWQQPQACSINRSFMVGPSQRQAPAGVWSWRQALCTRVPAAETSMHLDCIRHHLTPKSSRKLARSVGASWRPRCRCLVVAASILHSSAGGIDEHAHQSATASHRGAAMSVLNQSQLHGSPVSKVSTCRCLVVAASTLQTSAGGRDEHAP